MAIATAPAHTTSYLMKHGVPHIEDPTLATVSLCGEACGRHAGLPDPGRAEVCGKCVAIAAGPGCPPA